MISGPPSLFTRSRLLTGVLALTLALLFPKAAVCADNCGSLERMASALRFAQAVYPELKEKEFGLSFSPGNGTFVDFPTEADNFMIRVGEPIWIPAGEMVDQYYAVDLRAVRSSGIELPLNLSFSFAKAGPSVRQRHLSCQPVTFTGTVGYEQLKKVQSAIDPHPEWSDEEELRVARKLGLRYGPEDKSSLLQKLPLKELAQFYGKLRVESATFSMNAGVKCAGCSFVAPSWQITVSESGNFRGLLIIIEPFFGKITSIAE
ncbi:MAG TPA: hypothetical protein VI386_29480 [Candidatus Sulfotelmatobacter sp.]